MLLEVQLPVIFRVVLSLVFLYPTFEMILLNEVMGLLVGYRATVEQVWGSLLCVILNKIYFDHIFLTVLLLPVGYISHTHYTLLRTSSSLGYNGQTVRVSTKRYQPTIVYA